MGRTGVLLLGFGGPDSYDAVVPFMCNLMGREPSDELADRICRRYLTIGGHSPLPGLAFAIAAGLQKRLEKLGHDTPVSVGMRYWDPYIKDGLASLKAAGCDRVVTVSLSPFESKVASGAYREAVAEALDELGGLEVVEAGLVSERPEFVEFMAAATRASLDEVPEKDKAVILFPAHSLPLGDLVDDDPYISGLEQTADAVAEKLGLPAGAHGAGEPVLSGVEAFGSTDGSQPWFFVYQSKGDRPGGWLGPDLESVIDAIPVTPDASVVVVPIGFMTDHMETLYDLDVLAAEQTLNKGLEWSRAVVPNEDGSVLDAMVELIVERL
jgi:protoporphyrin/coproporphyrin ferrochelatase